MNEFERRKLEVGMAPYGSREYLLNATYVLSSNTHHPEGREKLKALRDIVRRSRRRLRPAMP